MHPLNPASANVALWEGMVDSRNRRTQIARMGVDAPTAEEFYQKYGHGPLLNRRAMFEMLYVLKNNPSWDNVAWSTHSNQTNETIWKGF